MSSCHFVFWHGSTHSSLSERRMRTTTMLVFVAAATVLVSALPTEAMKPDWDYGDQYLLVYKEAGDNTSVVTQYAAVVGGVERWYSEMYYHVNQYVYAGPHWEYMWIPGYGPDYVYVTAEWLANSIYNIDYFGFDRLPANVGDKIKAAIGQDFYNYHYGSEPTWFDPYGDWKWRSDYMEQRYADNSDGDRALPAAANCWATADYLAKDLEWAQGYSAYKQAAPGNWSTPVPYFQQGQYIGWNYAAVTTQGVTFPRFYLDGWQYQNNYCIDDDLDPNENARAELVTHGMAGQVSPYWWINAFDVIRIAEETHDPTGDQPENEDFMLGGTLNLGTNGHCVAYLCTDRSGNPWIYEKHNYGSPYLCPYGINILGDDQWGGNVLSVGGWDNGYNSYFWKYGDNKNNLAASGEYSWVPSGYGIP